MERKRRVAIIGGGITGLAAAVKLEKANLDYEILEASHRLGGKIKTERIKNFVIETGPDSFLARKESMSRLAHDVGLGDELIANDTGQAFILKGERLHPIPAGAVMGIPTELLSFAASELCSPLGKLRVLGDLLLPKMVEKDEDISIGHFFRRRLGDEAVDHLIEPLLSGIYSGDIDRLSLKATFPQFQQVEEAHGSLIRGMKQKHSKQADSASKPKAKFLTFRRGLQSFIDALEGQIPPEKIRLQTVSKTIEKNAVRLSNLFSGWHECGL